MDFPLLCPATRSPPDVVVVVVVVVLVVVSAVDTPQFVGPHSARPSLINYEPRVPTK